jgi:transcriptional regulator GlxA family with amidase domain
VVWIGRAWPQRRAEGEIAAVPTQETTFERHYSVDEVAELWGMSDDFVRRLFLNEPGVVVFFKHRPGRRTYRTLRIPESVAQRVHRKMRKDEA